MKSFLFACTLLLSSFAYSQTKEDNMIIIKSDQDNLYRVAGMALVQNGFALKNTNEEFGTLNTEWKIMSENGSYRLDVVIVKDEIRIRGFFKNDLTNAMFNTQSQDRQITYNKKGPFLYMWNLIEAVANEIEGEKMYARK